MLPSLVETASTPLKEVHHVLNATRNRLDNIAITFAGCNAVMRQVELAEKGEQSPAVQTAANADHEASKMCKNMTSTSETMRTLLCEENRMT